MNNGKANEYIAYTTWVAKGQRDDDLCHGHKGWRVAPYAPTIYMRCSASGVSAPYKQNAPSK